MKQIFLFLILLIAACTPADRNKVWLQEAERHYSQGNMDSTQSCLYKVNEDKLTGEDKYTFCRVKSSCSLASTPAEVELLYETVRYYEQKKDSAHLKAMRMILTQNFMFGREYGRADSLLAVMHDEFLQHNDTAGIQWVYAIKCNIFSHQNKVDSALAYMDKRMALQTREGAVRNLLCKKAEYLIEAKRYDEAEQHLDSLRAMAESTTDVDYLNYLTERYRQLYHEQARYDKLMELLQASRQYMRRKDVPAHNMYKAQLYDLKHQEDSARYYYHLVAQSENLFLATEAMHHLSRHYLTLGDAEKAYQYHQDVAGYVNQVYTSYRGQARGNAFNELKLTTEIDALKISRQQQVIVIVSLLFLLFIAGAGMVFFVQTKKKRDLMLRQMQMEQENQLLRQAEELALLREKSGLLREELIRKMAVFQKLPSLNEDLAQNDKAISITEREWKEIRRLLDAEYEQFTVRLLKAVPGMNTADINFCCLLKINVSMQDLANVYCINKASISRRKQRVKEKIGPELLQGQTLDDFLQRF